MSPTSAVDAAQRVAASSVAATMAGMEVVGITGVAEILGVTRQHADRLSKQRGFPKPVSELSRGRVWSAAAVRGYAKRRRNGGRPRR